MIVVLTAHATLESAIAAVKSDAVDYLLKPINIEGLSATISQALQGRAEQLQRQHLLDVVGQALDTLRQTEKPVAPSSAPPISPDHPPTSLARFLRAGPLTLDRHKRLAMTKGHPVRTVELTEGEAAILVTLMEHPNEVLSCDQLARAAMGYDLDKWAAQSRRCVPVSLCRSHEVQLGASTWGRIIRQSGSVTYEGSASESLYFVNKGTGVDGAQVSGIIPFTAVELDSNHISRFY